MLLTATVSIPSKPGLVPMMGRALCMAAVAGSIPVASPKNLMRDRKVAIRESHKLVTVGSNPTPATINPAIGRTVRFAETQPDHFSR